MHIPTILTVSAFKLYSANQAPEKGGGGGGGGGGEGRSGGIPVYLWSQYTDITHCQGKQYSGLFRV